MRDALELEDSERGSRESAGPHRTLSVAKATWAAPTAARCLSSEEEEVPWARICLLPAWVAICAPAGSRPTQGSLEGPPELFPVLRYPDSTPLSFQGELTPSTL